MRPTHPQTVRRQQHKQDEANTSTEAWRHHQEGQPPITAGTDRAIRFDSLPYPHARKACKRCACETGYLVKFITTRNRVELRLCCDNCEKCDSTLNLPREPLGITDLGVLPTINQGTYDTPGNCWICDEQAVDWHHWAPASIFPDWPDNHSVPVCGDCHNEWHDRMRTHGLRYPHELET